MQVATTDQSKSEVWLQARQWRVTAFKFGVVCNRPYRVSTHPVWFEVYWVTTKKLIQQHFDIVEIPRLPLAACTKVLAEISSKAADFLFMNCITTLELPLMA